MRRITSPAVTIFCALSFWCTWFSCRPAGGDDGNLQPPPAPQSGVVEAASASSAEANRLFAESLQLLKTNRAFEARSPLEKAALLEPNSSGIRNNLGLAYQNSGNIDRAISEFEQALRLQPGMPAATLNLAGCYQSLGRSTQAIEWFDRYLNLKPTPPDANQVRDILSAITAISRKPGSDPNLPDYLPGVTAGGVYRWPVQKLPMRVYISNGNGVEGFRDNFRNALIESFEAWMIASGNRLSFTLVADRGQADVVCDWTSNPSEVSRAGTQSERGITDVIANEGNVIQRARIKILTRPVIEEGTLSDDDMKKACLHEVGHVLGLQGHSTNNHDVMFYTIDTSTVWPVLTKRDKATISALYDLYPIRQDQLP